MKVLICGAGIAGPALAYWLVHYGLEPTIVEKAPKLRTGGYVIDFWGVGFDIAEQMGALPAIRSAGYMVEEVRIVDRGGKRVAGFPVEAVARLAQGRYVSLARGDLATSIFDRIQGKIETIFGDSIVQIERDGSGVRVVFESGAARHFDLVIGADGLHSRVRALAFGPQSRFEKYLGFKVAAFEAEGYRPRDELVYVMYTQVGAQVGRFSMRGNRTMFLFVFAEQGIEETAANDMQAQKAALRTRFGNSEWECPQILDALDATNDLYFDRVSQIQLGSQAGSWARGRVTLVGDAASCVSLLAGQGSALAMVAAYILAGELHVARGDYATAFAQYQRRFGPFVLQKQRSALRFAGAFAPKSRSSMFLRNQIVNLLRIPWIADVVLRRDLSDRIAMPTYE